MSHQNRLVLSPRQTPSSSPVSPIQSLTPSTNAFAIPLFLFFLSTATSPITPPAPDVTEVEEPLGTPIAYSEPIVGNTFSPALKLTNSAKGTNQTHRPKYDAISVN